MYATALALNPRRRTARMSDGMDPSRPEEIHPPRVA